MDNLERYVSKISHRTAIDVYKTAYDDATKVASTIDDKLSPLSSLGHHLSGNERTGHKINKLTRWAVPKWGSE